MTSTLNLLIVAIVLLMLARAAVGAWRNRGVAFAVWRRIRPRHLLGSLGLIVVVLAVAVLLATFVPLTRYGLGSLVGVQGNAVFAPVEDVLLQEPPEDASADAEPV